MTSSGYSIKKLVSNGLGAAFPQEALVNGVVKSRFMAFREALEAFNGRSFAVRSSVQRFARHTPSDPFRRLVDALTALELAEQQAGMPLVEVRHA